MPRSPGAVGRALAWSRSSVWIMLPAQAAFATALVFTVLVAEPLATRDFDQVIRWATTIPAIAAMLMGVAVFFVGAVVAGRVTLPATAASFTWSGLCVYLLLAWAYPSARYETYLAQHGAAATEVIYPFGAEVPPALVDLRRYLVDNPPPRISRMRDEPLLRGPTWVGMRLHQPAVIGVYTVLSGLLGFLLARATAGWRAVARWPLLVACGVGGLFALIGSLEVVDALTDRAAYLAAPGWYAWFTLAPHLLATGGATALDRRSSSRRLRALRPTSAKVVYLVVRPIPGIASVGDSIVVAQGSRTGTLTRALDEQTADIALSSYRDHLRKLSSPPLQRRPPHLRGPGRRT